MSSRFPKANLFLLIIIISSFAFSAFAQSLDQTFSHVLQDFGSSGNGFPTVSTTLVQPDGKILVGGNLPSPTARREAKLRVSMLIIRSIRRLMPTI